VAKLIDIEFDNGKRAIVSKNLTSDAGKLILRLIDRGDGPTAYVQLSIDDSEALRDALIHFE
jgi:hypothetical protein